eukprot:12623180-Heterocapsa_arctica.AAC.1
MIGDFKYLTGGQSSPQVRACLQTLKELGAVFQPASLKRSHTSVAEAAADIWRDIVQPRDVRRPGTTEEHAETAWAAALQAAKEEHLDNGSQTKLPHKLASYGPQGRGPATSSSGNTRNFGNENFIVKGGEPSAVMPVQEDTAFLENASLPGP